MISSASSTRGQTTLMLINSNGEVFKVLGRLKHISITKQNYALKHLLLAVSCRKKKKREEGKVSFCTPCRVGLSDFARDHGLPCFHLVNTPYFCLEDQAVSTHQQGIQRKQGVL